MSKNLVPTNVSPELDINLLDLEREIEKEISDNGGITTDGEEEIGFDDEELLELSEIEAELLEEEEEGVNIEAEDEATMQEIRERDFFYEENRETLVRKKLRNQEDDESFSEISTLSLFFKDVANFPFKVDKKSERDLLYLYAYIRGKGGDEWLDGKSSLDIPEHIF